MFKSGNLRKNLLRVKQIADQNLGRVEKTEVLSDDLQSAEKKVELVKNVCLSTVKKLRSSLVAFGTTDKEKRLKKMPEAVISQSMKDSASVLTTEGTMGYYSQMFERCGECQGLLARKHLQFELDVEKNVLDPMQDIVENEIPHITKLKKALNKVILDMDSARNRMNSAVRQSHAPGDNLQKASAQVDVIKEACTEAESKVDQAKDAYTTALFTFISKEADYSQNLLNLLIAQQEYHREALAVLDNMIPELKEELSCNSTKPVYGIPLEEHLRVSKCDIAVVLEICVNYMLEEGLEEEGLFRIAGMASKVKKLKALFDAKLPLDDMASEIDAHTVAGALKQYLRELPEPLLTFALFKDFVAAAQQPEDQRLQALWCVIDKLPKPNYDNFRYLIKFLAKLVEKSDVNKMTASNISIVIGPNLIWSHGDTGPNMSNTGILSLITELIVLNADWFFPGEQDFHATQRGCAVKHTIILRPGTITQIQDGKHTVIQGTGTITQTQDSNEKWVSAGPVNTKSIQNDPEEIIETFMSCASSDHYVASGHSVLRKDDNRLLETSTETSSTSSGSASLSDNVTQTKEYENADTLERDTADRYLTAKGDINMFISHPSLPTLTNKHADRIITFNPADRPKYKKLGSNTGQERLYDSVPEQLDNMQFTEDKWPSCVNKVQSLHNDQLLSQKAQTLKTEFGFTGNESMERRAKSSLDINFACGSSSTNGSPHLNQLESHQDISVTRVTPDQFSSAGVILQSSPAIIQQPVDQTSPQMPHISLKPASLSQPTTDVSVTAVAESKNLQPNQRKLARKPAPPPPERPFTVAVLADVKPSQQAPQYPTWPRQAVPLQEGIAMDLESMQKEKKPLVTDKPSLPEHFSSLPGHGQSGRPKIPPPVVASGHRRSASTGAPLGLPGSQLHHILGGEDFTGRTDAGNWNQSNSESQYSQTNQQIPLPGGKQVSSSVNKQSSMHLPRPLPSTPPSESTEQTHF